MNDLIISELAVMPVINLQVAKDRRDQMVMFVRQIMIDGIDYGTIPGTSKPTLHKPGAEKLTTFFGLSKRFEILEKIEDWTGADHGSEPFFYYLYRCVLYRGDQLIAEADGSCNSFESKYRYRKSERVCPNCGEANIRKSKQGGGWYCWQKTGGCGSTFAANAPEITNQETGRVPNPDVCDQVNTLQKMAQKRALVAATLLAVNASEFFTQDLEDYVIEADYAETPPQSPPQNGKPEKPNGKPAPQKPRVDEEKPYKFPSNAAETFWKQVQGSTENYYKNPFHLVEVLGGQWFNFGDQDLWGQKLDYAISHAQESWETQQEMDLGDKPQGGAAYGENS